MFLARPSPLMLTRGLVYGRGEARISAPSTSTAGYHKALVGLRKFENFLSRFVVVDNRPDRNFQNHIPAVASRLVGPFAVASALRGVLGIETEVHERVVALAGFHDYVAALAAVPSGWPAAGNELLAPESHAAIAAVSGLDSNFRLINKHRKTMSSTPTQSAKTKSLVPKARLCDE